MYYVNVSRMWPEIELGHVSSGTSLAPQFFSACDINSTQSSLGVSFIFYRSYFERVHRVIGRPRLPCFNKTKLQRSSSYHKTRSLVPRTPMGSCLRWLEQTWMSSAETARCMETQVSGDEETYLAPAHNRGPMLPSGAVLPSIGLGVYMGAPGDQTFSNDETYSAVITALRSGYRHIDTAQFYQNEADVGRALRASTVPRAEAFLTTKLWIDEWGYDKAIDAVKNSLNLMKTDYVDIMLLHAPGDPATRAETWRALEDCRSQGLIRDIGVSNFGEKHLERLSETAKVPPAVNQLEIHPWLQRRDLVAYCKSKNIIVEAWSPLAKASKLSDPVVNGIAAQHGSTPAQVLIAWSLAKGLVPLPKSFKPDRQRQNLAAAKLVLSEADVAALDGLEEGLVTGWDPVKDAPV